MRGSLNESIAAKCDSRTASNKTNGLKKANELPKENRDKERRNIKIKKT